MFLVHKILSLSGRGAALDSPSMTSPNYARQCTGKRSNPQEISQSHRPSKLSFSRKTNPNQKPRMNVISTCGIIKCIRIFHMRNSGLFRRNTCFYASSFLARPPRPYEPYAVVARASPPQLFVLSMSRNGCHCAHYPKPRPAELSIND